MRDKKILIINIGWEQEPLISSVFSKGLKVYAVHYNDQYNNTFNYEDVLIAELRDLDTILKYAKQHQVDYVVSDECDYSHFAQALVAENMHIPGPSVWNAQVSANKYIQRTAALNAGVLVPAFSLIRSIDDITEFLRTNTFPFILKPIDNRGSFGVVKVNTAEEVKEAYKNALVNSHSRLVLAEEFIDGYEITVDGYCFAEGPRSLSLAKKNKAGLNVQVSMDIKYPGEIPDDIYEKALRNNEFVTEKLGYSFGMTHSEYMIDKDGGIYLMESANRGGGVFTSEIIVPNVSGVDLVEVYLNDVLGNGKTMTPEKIEKNPVILKFFSFDEGIIGTINGVDAIKSNKNVLQFRLAVKEGDVIKPIENDGNRHGFLIVKSTGDVRKEAAEAFKMINISYL